MRLNLYKTAENHRAVNRTVRYVPKGKTGRILRDMQAGRKMTSIIAFQDYGETRLSSVIFNLKKYGYDIKDNWVETKCGDRYKVYYMEGK